MTLLVLIVASYVQANLLFWIFGLMAGGLVVSLITPLLMLRRLRVHRQAPDHGVAGQMMALRYDVAHRGRWLPAFGVVINETWGPGFSGWQRVGPVAERPRRLRARPHGWAIHVGPGQTVNVTAPCWPARRGMLRLEQIVAASSFPFGIFNWRIEFDQFDEVLIYPPLYRLNRRLIATLQEEDPHGLRRVDRGGGHEEFFGLREYHEWDSMKLIHWRRTAHAGQLVSKDLTQPSPPKVMVLLDLTERPGRIPDDTDAQALAERAISLTASVISESHHFGHQVGLTVRGALCPPFEMRYGVAHRTQMLEALARLDTANQLTDPGEPQPDPSIAIRVGYGDPLRRGGGHALTLGAAQMEQYVHGADLPPVRIVEDPA